MPLITRRRLLPVCLALGVGLFAGDGVSGAQEKKDARDLAQLTGLQPGEIVAMFDAYVLVQAQGMLNLDDAQYGRFITRLKALQEARRRNQQRRQRIVAELTRLARPDSKADDPAIADQLRMLREHDERTAIEVKKAYDGVDEVLSVRQQARFRVFEEQMERRKFEFLTRARQANRPKQQRPPL